jgi:hypothetical protein
MKNKSFFLVFLMATSCALTSCKKFLEVDPPIDRSISAKVFSSDKTATSAVIGLYSQMMVTFPTFTSGGITIYAGLSGDELYSTSTANPDLAEFVNNSLTSTNGFLSGDFWLRAHNLIYQANACIEGLTASSNISTATKQQLIGEAKFVRAYVYFYLVNLFGDVPLITSTDYNENSNLPRYPATEVYTQIVRDLKDAQSLLTVSYTTGERVRPNKLAATALLARTYLYLNDWPNAEAESTAVINSGDYSLDADLNSVFLANSNEAIWQIMPVSPGFNTTEGRFLIPSPSASSKPNYPITSLLSSAFEIGDQRKLFWVKSKLISGELFEYPFKYKIRALNQPVTEYYMILRLAEQFLIRAESRINLNNLPGAQDDINIIRNRAGLPNTTAVDAINLTTALEQERRIELFAEWGHRWLDLKRTNKVDLTLAPIKPGWQPTDALYPIPQIELLRNPLLTQNPGY